MSSEQDCPACYDGTASTVDDEGNERDVICDECDGTGKVPSDEVARPLTDETGLLHDRIHPASGRLIASAPVFGARASDCPGLLDLAEPGPDHGREARGAGVYAAALEGLAP